MRSSGLPLLTTCSLAETTKPATKDASYAWGTETWDPSSNLTIVANDADNTVGVVADQPAASGCWVASPSPST